MLERYIKNRCTVRVAVYRYLSIYHEIVPTVNWSIISYYGRILLQKYYQIKSLNICKWRYERIKMGLKVVWTVGGVKEYQDILVDQVCV
jgi:hypothetical protein